MQELNSETLDSNPSQPFINNLAQPMPYSIIQQNSPQIQAPIPQGLPTMGNMGNMPNMGNMGNMPNMPNMGNIPGQVVEINPQQQIPQIDLSSPAYQIIPIQPQMQYAQASRMAQLSEEEINDIKSNFCDGAEIIIEKNYNVEPCKPLYDMCAHSPYYIVKSRKNGTIRNLFIAKLNLPCCCEDMCKSSCIESDKTYDIKMKYLHVQDSIQPFINNSELPEPCAECFLARHTCNLNMLQSVTTGCSNEILINHQVELFNCTPGTVTVHEPQLFCGIPTITIRDNQQKIIYRIASNTCNIPCCLFKGLLNCLVSCENAFNIFDEYGLKTLGRIYKSAYPCTPCAFPTYYYFIFFPEESSFPQKMQILFAAMLFDRYYYDKHNYIR